jgi:TetR/AcrR family transcriptional regulator, transcriptional repressor for nem operon
MSRTANPQTRQKLLDAAEAVMLRKGYAAASVEEICDAAGLTKGSFFHYFETKEAIAIEAVKRFYERGQAWFRSLPYRQLRDPLQRVYGHCDALIAMARDPVAMRGCLVGTIAQEMAASDRTMRGVCRACFNDWADDLRKDIELAKAEHAPRARWEPQTLAEHCVAVTEGALILVKAAGDGRPMAESIGHLKRYLKLLFEGNA